MVVAPVLAAAGASGQSLLCLFPLVLRVSSRRERRSMSAPRMAVTRRPSLVPKIIIKKKAVSRVYSKPASCECDFFLIFFFVVEFLLSFEDWGRNKKRGRTLYISCQPTRFTLAGA